ncbi:haloalkane dehalogenase [Conexibacter sp. DBS9H8]|uniref:haloalkane dehalogenase n=1 Tax=Conexibacter sp. DBS9H8 TaxID=2937801 RepID=UPI00201025FD|nr:haloalkane dehalogenase [Conexibacter sp. DBS9H8]
MTPTALRTPEARFANLPDFPYAPHYVEDLPGYEGLRMARVDEGPSTGAPTFLCLHGQPTWSYLYRKMIPVFAAAGARVVAPDLFGFGRSDKPLEEPAYTFSFHRDSLLALIRHLDLRDVTLVVQDWGGVLGLTLPVEPDIAPRISRLLVMNTGLAVGVPISEGFEAWRAYNAGQDDLAVGTLLARSEPSLSAAEAAAYDAPFPDRSYKAGVRRFPELVMTRPDMDGVDVSRAAARFWNKEWHGPTFMAIGLRDPVLGAPVMHRLAALINGCPEPLVLEQAGHFTQEHGERIAIAALAAFSAAAS